jgi:iron complex outermembrane receptor protein
MDSTYQWDIPGGTNFLTVYGNYPRPIATIVDGLQDKSWIQEFRLVSNGTHLFDYVVGAYFQHETGVSIFNQYILELTESNTAVGLPPLPNPQTGDTVVYGDTVTTFTDRALFGELTWHATSAWQVTGGTRLFSQSFDENSTTDDPKCGSACGNSLGGSSVNNTQSARRPLYKLNTSYDIAKDTKLYAIFSEGFRRGGATGLAVVGPFASEAQYSTFKPDLVKNYEAGIKGDLDHDRFRYVADVFYIDLLNFQFDSYSPSGSPAVYNGSTAKSKGGGAANGRAIHQSALWDIQLYLHGRGGFDFDQYIRLAPLCGCGKRRSGARADSRGADSLGHSAPRRAQECL